jgi:sugar phosphate isomerase/epimerase
VEHSVRLAKMAKRDNVGSVFNLCHLLRKEGAEGWKRKLDESLPYLYMLSICGADAGNTTEMGWKELIQPLGEGSFDTYALVKYAKDKGYEGPIGLQCYKIKQDAEVALAKSINTWKEYQKHYAEESK